MFLLATILFIVLSPGVLLTLPPVGKVIFMSRKTSLIAVLVHAVVFYFILRWRKSLPLVNSIEGFGQASGQKGVGASCQADSECKTNSCKNQKTITNSRGRTFTIPGNCKRNPPLNDGESCNNNFDCESERCDLGKKCRGNRQTNDSCTTNVNCALGNICKNGVCKLKGGEFCFGNDNVCASNKCRTYPKIGDLCV